MSYIGKGQAAVMLSLFGVVYCLLETAYKPLGRMLPDIVSAAVLIGIMVIPVCVLSLTGKGSVPERCAEKLGFAGRAINVLYFVYFLSASANILGRYSVYVSERYFREGGALVCTLLLGAICLYISHTGAETVSRMSTVLLFLMILFSAVFVIGAYGDMSGIENLEAEYGKFTLSDCFGGLFPIGAAGAVSLCVLCGGLEKRTRSGAYYGIAAMLIAAALTAAASAVTIGDYVYETEYPLTDAVIYAARNDSFRNDGMFFALWTVIAAAVISLLCACGGHALKNALPMIKGEGVISAAAAVICACAAVISGKDKLALLYEEPIAAMVFASAVPLILIISGSREKKEEKA